jgi:hypothetical protein
MLLVRMSGLKKYFSGILKSRWNKKVGCVWLGKGVMSVAVESTFRE